VCAADPPRVRDESWVRNPIDRFILAKLEQEDIEPSPEAGKLTLARRLYLDLIGLPPAPKQIAEFLADNRPDAYEHLVDALLESPHFGEKWARPWLLMNRPIPGPAKVCGFCLGRGTRRSHCAYEQRPAAWVDGRIDDAS